MWTEEKLSDAMKVLLDAESIEKVTTPESSYLVASRITYNDDLYLRALIELESREQIEKVSGDGERSVYRPKRQNS